MNTKAGEKISRRMSQCFAYAVIVVDVIGSDFTYATTCIDDRKKPFPNLLALLNSTDKGYIIFVSRDVQQFLFEVYIQGYSITYLERAWAWAGGSLCKRRTLIQMLCR
jgi:hypothetical protein